MHLRCPNCHVDLDVVPAAAVIEVKCPSCGSLVDVSGSQETIEYRPPKLGRLGHFVLVEHIGRGHFGDVYKATDSRLERTVAVKVPRSADLGFMERETFFREARTAARLKHPNIVTIHDVDAIGETIYIASEFVDGVNLADKIARRPMEPRAAAAVAARIGEALEHAHQQGVIHRDLKPRNVMLDEQGQPHLLDFGLAKQSATEFTITADGEILGTPAYMAPEQARGQAGAADARTDVYSLGVTLYEMLTGTPPFLGDARGLIYQVLHEEPAPPRKLERNIPRDLETICLKAMAKEPGRRYEAAGEMAADLNRFLAGEPIHARRAGLLERSLRWCRRNPAWTTACGLGTAAVVLLGVMIASAAWAAPAKPIVEIDVRLAVGPLARPGDPPANSARAVFWPLNGEGEPITDRPTRVSGQPPLRTRLEPGDYFVVIVGDDDRFHEVYRHVPAVAEKYSSGHVHLRWDTLPDGTVRLPDVTLPLSSVTAGMVRFSGSTGFVMGASDSMELAAHQRSLPAYYLDAHEVTIAEFGQSNAAKLPAELVGRPGNHAVTYVPFDVAASLAEERGKTLPTETQFEFAATQGGARRFPWGDDQAAIKSWPIGEIGAAGYDQMATNPPIVGLYSNAAEWTRTWMQYYPAMKATGSLLPGNLQAGNFRVVRGAPRSVIDGTARQDDWSIGPRHRQMETRAKFSASIGFRCARSAQPHLQPADFERVINQIAGAIESD